MTHNPTTHEPKVGALVRDTLDGLSALVASHFKLLRAELGTDARAYGRLAVRVTLTVAVLLLGYALVCVAAALALARATGTSHAVGFLAIGGAHVLVALIVLRVVLKRTAGPPLGVTRAELDQTVAVFSPERSEAHAHP